MMSDNIMLDL